MKFDYTGRHIEVTPAIKAHVEEQFSKLTKLFDGKEPQIHVVIEVERGLHRSEVVINWRNDVLTAETVADDMYQSLTQTISKIEKQGRRLKDKVIDKSHKAQKASTLIAEGDSL